MKNTNALLSLPIAAPRKAVGLGYTSSSWSPFEHKLAVTLAGLEEDQYLILSVKGTNRFVQFAAQGAFGMRVETTSNSYLSTQEQLYAKQISSLLEAGWQAPTGSANESTPENDPDGSPNFFVEFVAPVALRSVAKLAIQTFTMILNVPYPLALEYEAFESDGEVLTLPELGLKQAKQASRDDQHEKHPENLPVLLLATLRQHTGLEDLAYDDDGDICLQYGGAQVYVRLLSGAPFVRYCCRILDDLEPSHALLLHLNDMNTREPMVHFAVRGEAIFALADTCVAPFEAEHVTLALAHFCVIVDSMASLLQADFGGQTTCVDLMSSSLRH